MKFVKAKVIVNKKNNQLLVNINKKSLGIKGKVPRFIKINKKDLIFK